MSINFIPTIWAARLLDALEKALIYAQEGVVNRDYEGEINKAGDSVKIGSLGSVAVGDYARDTDMSIQVLQDAEQMLAIDQQKYFNFMVDDVDQAQQNANTIDSAMRNAAYELKNIADQRVAAHYVNAVADTGVGDDTTPLNALASGVAYKLLVDLGTKLDNRDVPMHGRFVIVPPFFHAALLMDDRFTGTGGIVAEQALANGQVGRAAGFDILKSTNVPNTADAKYKIIAGHAIAMTYAEQILKVETYTTAKRFGTGVKGLHVYGCKLVRPYAWAVGTVNNAAS
jgi:hypothetical protein